MTPHVQSSHIHSLTTVVGTSRILTSVHPHSTHCRPDQENESSSTLFRRYFLATLASRMSLWALYEKICYKHVHVPPASIPVLESLGVATAFALVDDELACAPHSIPQQLLIPSKKGFKLLDLCPDGDQFEDSQDDRSGSDSDTTTWRKTRGNSEDDSDDDSVLSVPVHNLSFRNVPKRLRRRRRLSSRVSTVDGVEQTLRPTKVQFEEPHWWQFLPSLKCIGLACLLNEEAKQTGVDETTTKPDSYGYKSAQQALIRMVCHERYTRQLQLLAECIGFSKEPNNIGEHGDISVFTECLRLQLISGKLFRKRVALDAHERGTEQSRWWGLLRPDTTSVIVKDRRTEAYQLLTVGDPSVVTELCSESWQGEIGTILPLAQVDRESIVDIARDWKLGDLDVAAFSYTPVPYTLEEHLLNDPQSRVR